MVTLPTDLSAMLRHLESCYPNEGCGLILQGKEGARIRPMQNAYDRYHERDPAQFPRTSRTAYRFDSKEWLQVTREAEAQGEEVVCIFHSHGDVGAYFSKEDQDMAAPEGEPVLPGVCYIVVAVNGGQSKAVRRYDWDGGQFSETTIFEKD
jgi:proteasome lid subunit RPN8/RPN11